MKRSSRRILSVLSTLVILSMACSFLSAGEKSTKTPNSENPSTPTGKSNDVSNDVLGEEYRSEGGGFSIQKIKDFQFEDVIGIVNMRAKNSDPNIGPGIMVMGGTMEKEYTNDELFTKMQQGTSALKLINSKKVKVNQVDGLMADLEGTYNDQPVKGKVVVAMVTPTQQFNMMGIAPADRWNDLAPIYDTVLGSVKFFEPKVETAAATDVPPTPKPAVDSTQTGPALINQWATSATASSSYSKTNWSPSQATGSPNVDNCGDNGLAWASSKNNTVEWIELTYDTPVVPTEINIYQSLNPSQVVEVYMTDVDGGKYIVWEGEPEKVATCPDLMTITIDLEKKILVNKIRIVVDQSVMKWGWDEIDAVELVGYNDNVKPKVTPKPQPTVSSSQKTTPATNAAAPTNFTGWMAGPAYQGYLKVVPGKTRVDELNKLIGIDGARSTDSWKPRPDHADTFLYKFGKDNMIAWISVTTKGIVYKKAISSNTHPSDFNLDTVTKANYDKLDAIFKRDQVIPYNVVANTLKSPGFLLEQYLRDDGKMADTYQWYHANGDLMSGFFYDGLLTGIAGLAFIPHK